MLMITVQLCVFLAALSPEKAPDRGNSIQLRTKKRNNFGVSISLTNEPCPRRVQSFLSFPSDLKHQMGGTLMCWNNFSAD